jgi:inhibitor of KinA
MSWFRYGPHALMFLFAGELGEAAFQKGRAILASLQQSPPEGLIEFIPAFASVLLIFEPACEPDLERRAPELAHRLETAATHPAPPAPLKTIPVVYDGPDLERVALHNQIHVSLVPEIHSRVIYQVYMLGFAPGFPYLGDLDPRLHTPRLPNPRPRVPAGSVAIGGEHTGIYSVPSAGGWNIIGHTLATLFDPHPDGPSGAPLTTFLLAPGDRVQFTLLQP